MYMEILRIKNSKSLLKKKEEEKEEEEEGLSLLDIRLIIKPV